MSFVFTLSVGVYPLYPIKWWFVIYYLLGTELRDGGTQGGDVIDTLTLLFLDCQLCLRDMFIHQLNLAIMHTHAH